MEEEPIMCKRNLRLLVCLCSMVTLAFSQDVTFTVQPNGNLEYESTADVYGIQFDVIYDASELYIESSDITSPLNIDV